MNARTISKTSPQVYARTARLLHLIGIGGRIIVDGNAAATSRKMPQ